LAKKNTKIIKKDKWFMDRFLPLVYKGIIYDDIESLMKEHLEMSIHTDHNNLINPPLDMHPSKQCHQLIAQNIIKKLNYERTATISL
jgi:hypothetical protein